MILWTAYRQWFTENYNAYSPDLLETGSVECNGGPYLGPTDARYPTRAPWKAEWAVVYRDGNYFRVKEVFRPVGVRGVRDHFSFHYGRAHPMLDAKGYPVTDPARNPPPADLRIDKDAYKPHHIHVGTTEHIFQDRVDGFTISDAKMFSFLDAVAEHRRTQEPLVDLLKIKVR